MEKQTTLEERFGKCPYATAQSLISGKWAVLILMYLEDGPIRFNELLRKMPKMTHATLSVQLKDLEERGLISRKQYDGIPAKVEYSLTEIGKKFHPVIAAKPANPTSLGHWPNYFCDKCTLYCPLGRWSERFAARGLSGFDGKGAAE